MAYRLIVTASLVLVMSCGSHVETPLTRACMASVGGDPSTDPRSLQQCRCADEITQRQLDDRAYAAVTRIAESFADRSGSAAGLETISTISGFVWRVGAIEGTLAGADLVLLLGKVATRCVWMP